ncbi:ABC transporter ATP-binding protein [Microtetraspora niveoalba]|uniref:ABC transporter ATP-binding protein n=1 Tax=Microtetraspora niveoalba TaxID=46175 RepID=UPI000A9C921A|nr:ABC transporter ATP-binding protein [Microtetraspora niveoalba]
MADAQAVLRVTGLTVELDRQGGSTPLVTDVSFAIGRGEMVGMVGESGSGKSLTASAVAGVLPRGVRPAGGAIEVDGAVDGGATGPATRRAARRGVAMVFQNPMTSLNPSMRVGDQVAEAIRLRRPGTSRREARRAAVEALDRVEITRPAERARQYPFEFSGGMRQRVMIAIAIAGEPSVLVADEPTTALDVTVQRGVMDLLDRLRLDLGLAVLFVSHDLALVGERCDRLLVMYAGELVESGVTADVLRRPSHPYVRALQQCTPEHALAVGALRPLPGRVPQAGEVRSGCRFTPRCALRTEECERDHPALETRGSGHLVRCHHARGSEE